MRPLWLFAAPPVPRGMSMVDSWTHWGGLVLAACAAVYGVVAVLATAIRIRPAPRTTASLPPVTLFKPLCGAEVETYDCLRSFCDQDYPDFEIIFGVADASDPVVAIVESLKREFPRRRLQLVVDRRQHGSSRKVSNLVNMMPLAKHEFFVISDSDVRVDRRYLANVVGPLLDETVGIVTCPYRGIPRAGLWSHLGSLFINEWFMPSVRVAALCGSRAFAFGVTIAISRRALARIGGFTAIANQLADDYRLGEMTRRLGLRTVLSDVVVETNVVEASLADLVRHELRWLRTIRAVRPVGYCLSFITFGVPIALLGALLTGGAAPAFAMLAVTSAARILLHIKTRDPNASLRQLWLLPLRDLLSVALWSWSFVTRRVRWRDDHFLVSRDGSVLPVARV